jgi:hypothetical protein
MITNSHHIIIFLFLGLTVVLSGQPVNHCRISGKVSDFNTGEPIQLVNVYLSGTTFGASTSETGIYCMENVPEGTYQLIFQHIGYKTKAEAIQLEVNQKYYRDAQLLPLIFDSEKIQVTTTEPEEWKDQLEFFIRQFIGESGNAEECQILNPEVLNFQIDDESDEFTATTDSVIRIVNRALGYKITLVLGDFRCIDDYLSLYLIYPRFELLVADDEDEEEQWLENRYKTYTASSKHFFSALARRKMNEENFNLLSADNINVLLRGHGSYLDSEYLRIQDMRTPLYKKFFLDDYLLISYSPEDIHPPSIIFFNQDYIIIDTLGNLITPENVKIAGEWYKKRVADILPMEYIP